MTDIFKSCVTSFNQFAVDFATQINEEADAVERAATIYSIKALTFDATTVLAIADVALLALGVVNPFAGLVILGLSLLGRVVAEESMNLGEQAVGKLVEQVKFGKHVLFYDTVPSMTRCFEAIEE